MRDRLFTIIDGEPIINPPLVNLSPFRKLWDQDDTDDKSNFKKWMLYIYYKCDYRSPFFEVKDNETEIIKEIFGRPKLAIPKKVQDCMMAYKKHNVPAEQRTLESAIVSADGINDMITRFQTESQQLSKVIKEIEKEIDLAMSMKEISRATALMKEKMDLQNSQLDITKKMSDLIPKIEKNVESIINLKDKVTNALRQVEDSGDRLEDYIIDDLISMKERGDIIKNISR